MSFLFGFLITIVLYIILRNYLDNRRNEQLKRERAVDGNFRPKNASKTVCSILTGVPVQVRYGDGGLTGAGAQEMQWCNQMLKEIGKKKYLVKKIMSGKQKFTKQQILDHLNLI